MARLKESRGALRVPTGQAWVASGVRLVLIPRLGYVLRALQQKCEAHAKFPDKMDNNFERDREQRASEKLGKK